MELQVLDSVSSVQADALFQGWEEKKINSYGVILKGELFTQINWSRKWAIYKTYLKYEYHP